jgi:hypothetical protein
MEVLLPGLYHHIVVSGYKYSKALASQNFRYHALMRYLSESKDLARRRIFFYTLLLENLGVLYSSLGYCLNIMRTVHHDLFSD